MDLSEIIIFNINPHQSGPEDWSQQQQQKFLLAKLVQNIRSKTSSKQRKLKIHQIKASTWNF